MLDNTSDRSTGAIPPDAAAAAGTAAAAAPLGALPTPVLLLDALLVLPAGS